MGIFFIFTEEKTTKNDLFSLILVNGNFTLTYFYFGSNCKRALTMFGSTEVQYIFTDV